MVFVERVFWPPSPQATLPPSPETKKLKNKKHSSTRNTEPRPEERPKRQRGLEILIDDLKSFEKNGGVFDSFCKEVVVFEALRHLFFCIYFYFRKYIHLVLYLLRAFCIQQGQFIFDVLRGLHMSSYGCECKPNVPILFGWV